jgi:hypothetical protein
MKGLLDNLYENGLINRTEQEKVEVRFKWGRFRVRLREEL